MASSSRTYNPDKDSLMKAAALVDIVDRIDSMDYKAQQLNIAQQQLGLSQREEQRGIQDQQNKLNAHGAVADFVSAFDPTDMDHRQKADWYRSWATGQGMSSQEVDNAFKRVDAQLSATNSLLETYKQNGVMDWEKTPDGKRIDVQATEFKARQNSQEMEAAMKTWGPRDKELHKVLSNATDASTGKPVYKLSDSVALVNANREILNDYLEVSAEGLWVAPENFAKEFAMSADSSQKGLVQQNDSLGYGRPAIYNRDALELNQGFIKARSIARRMATGEVPIFQTDENGNTRHDNQGVAIVTGWTRSKDDSAVIKAGAEAVIANEEAKNKQALGLIGGRADVAAKLTNAKNNAFDAGTLAGIDADMAALYGNTDKAVAGQPVTNDAQSKKGGTGPKPSVLGRFTTPSPTPLPNGP